MKRKQFILSLSFGVLLLSVVSSLAFANHNSLVLGVSTTQARVEMPATHGGPGFILPDSPLYGLDHVKQALRIALAIGSEARAKVYTEVANERLAEVRLMLAKQDEKGVRVALEGMYDSFESASEEINNARLRGKDVSQTAKSIVEIMREHQKALDVVQKQAQGVLEKQLAVAQESLLVSKVKVEEALEAQDLADEIQYDLERQGRVVLGEATKDTPSPTIAQPVTPATSSVSTFQR